MIISLDLKIYLTKGFSLFTIIQTYSKRSKLTQLNRNHFSLNVFFSHILTKLNLENDVQNFEEGPSVYYGKALCNYKVSTDPHLTVQPSSGICGSKNENRNRKSGLWWLGCAVLAGP